jgi:hypothetical protein
MAYGAILQKKEIQVRIVREWRWKEIRKRNDS